MLDKLLCNNCGAQNSLNSKYCCQCGFELPQATKENLDTLEAGPKKSKNNFKSQFFGVIVGTLAVALGGYFAQQVFFKAPAFDKAMMAMASEINKTCPVMVDQVTRLDNAIALPGNIFQYNYTILGINRSQINIDTLEKYVEPGIINNIRTNPDMKVFRDQKTTLVYYYKDESGTFIHKFVITPDRYK
jgi:hypothetical protein